MYSRFHIGSRNVLAKRKVQNVLHRLLAEVVIDAENGGFRKYFVQRAIERLRAGEIAAEGLLDDDPGIVRRIRTFASPWTTLANMLGGIAR